MIVDSSAVLAILFAEEAAPRYATAIAAADTCRMSAANWLESAIRPGLPLPTRSSLEPELRPDPGGR